MEKGQTILIVDPETDFLEWAQHQLQTGTTRVLTATTADEGYKVFCREDPDLLIRTSGELRLSNFLLWQLSYAEIVVTQKLWPDFGKQELREAIAEFARRERRYGGV